MPKRDILTEFQQYYASLSPDAQEIVRRLVLTEPEKPKSSKSKPPARSARSQSLQKQLAAGREANTRVDEESAGNASTAAAGGD